MKEFLTAFLLAEYQCNKAKYDDNISDEKYDILRDKTNSFFHSLLGNLYGRAGAIDNKSDMWVMLRKKNVENARQRLLFQIRSYIDFELGHTLKEVVKGNVLYRVDMSYDGLTSAEFSKITNGFYLTETNEGLKIIYNKPFGQEEGWRHSHDVLRLQVINEGKQIEVERIEPPLESYSLKEYNKE